MKQITKQLGPVVVREGYEDLSRVYQGTCTYNIFVANIERIYRTCNIG